MTQKAQRPVPPAGRRFAHGRLLRIGFLWLAAVVPQAHANDGLPPEVGDELDRASVPRDAVGAMVQEVGAARPLLTWQVDKPVNPASMMKLFTTYASLELLGLAWTWSTPVWLHGAVRDGVLEGNLVIKGTGDPKLVIERMWLLLRRVQQLGVREIRGDIVLDRASFAEPPRSPADFDGESLRPYNVLPDALMLDFKSVALTFSPNAARGIAVISADPPSPALPEVVRDINKFSNNVMAQQLFLTLGLTHRGSGSPEAAREVLRHWATERFGAAAHGMVIDNGSGLSRDTRVSALLLTRLLLSAQAGPVMAELTDLLSVSGIDGTLKDSHLPPGRAHLKTGTLRDVSGMAWLRARRLGTALCRRGHRQPRQRERRAPCFRGASPVDSR